MIKPSPLPGTLKKGPVVVGAAGFFILLRGHGSAARIEYLLRELMVMNRKRQAGALSCVLLFLLLNYPLVSIADKPGKAGNLPLLYAYLLVVWGLFIIVLLWLSRRGGKSKAPHHE